MTGIGAFISAQTAGLLGGAEVTYSESAEALFARMDAQPEPEVKSLANTCISNLIGAGLWDKLDAIYVVGADQQQTLLNWKGDYWNATAHGTIDFVAYRGFKGDNVSFYLDTHFDPFVEMPLGSQFQKDSLSFGSAVQDTNGTGTARRYIMGVYAGASNAAIDQNHASGGTNLASFKIGSAANMVTTEATVAPHHWYGTRTSDTNTKLYMDGDVKHTATTNASQDWVSSSILLHARRRPDLGGTIENFNVIRQSFYFIGGGLTDDEAADLFYIMNEYLSGVGAEERVFPPEASALMAISPLNMTSGNAVDYTLSLVEGTYTGAIDIEVSEMDDSNFDTSFVSALQTAADSAVGVAFDGVKTLTFDESFSGTLTWSRTLTASPATGAPHAVVLSNATAHALRKPYAGAIVGTPVAITVPSMMIGVNLAGAEFGGTAFYQSAATVDYYADLGFEVARIPMKWERLQPTLFGAIDNTAITNYLIAVQRARDRGLYVVIDPHDFGGRKVDGVSRKIGDDELPVMAFLDLWDKLIDAIGLSDLYIYCINNEPSGIPQPRWWAIAQATTEFIRAKGIYNYLHTPGSGFSTASQWVSGGNAAQALLYTDPINNFAFDVHQYLDPNASGAEGTCAIGAANRVDVAITWAETNSKKLFFGEFGAGYPEVSGQEQCGTELPNLLDKITISTASTGGTAWAGGENWSSSYPFRLEPVDRDTSPVVSTLTTLQGYL